MNFKVERFLIFNVISLSIALNSLKWCRWGEFAEAVCEFYEQLQRQYADSSAEPYFLEKKIFQGPLDF